MVPKYNISCVYPVNYKQDENKKIIFLKDFTCIHE